MLVCILIKRESGLSKPRIKNSCWLASLAISVCYFSVRPLFFRRLSATRLIIRRTKMEGALEVSARSSALLTRRGRDPSLSWGWALPALLGAAPAASVCFVEGGCWGVKIRKGTILDNKDFSLFCTDTKANSWNSTGWRPKSVFLKTTHAWLASMGLFFTTFCLKMPVSDLS